MDFKEYLDNLNEYAKQNPETLKMQVVTSKDDEGNGYGLVHYTPSQGVFDDDDFIPKDNLEDFGHKEEDINAICVN